MYASSQAKKKGGPNLPKCADLLQNVFTADTTPNYASSCNVLPFSLDDLQSVMKCMKQNEVC